jgi:beta-glucuronidase
MNRKRNILNGTILLCLLIASGFAKATQDSTFDLNGSWHFTLDPIGRGEATGWAQPAPGWTGDRPHPPVQWDTVEVPHDFLTDLRYQHTGWGWYRRSVLIPDDMQEDLVWRLQFDRVFQRCRVWINGEYIGEHEGGYIPFEFAVTEAMRPGQYNLITVAVNNEIRFRALPGARTPEVGREGWPNAQMYAWLNYGGILGDVRLKAHAPVYITRQTLQADINETLDAVSFKARVTVRNDSPREQNVSVRVLVQEVGFSLSREVTLDPGSEQVVEMARDWPDDSGFRLWDVNAPNLYTAVAEVGSPFGNHYRKDRFGIRRIEAANGKLLLNGRPVRLAGANRTLGHPVFGGRDPEESVAHDMILMKAAGLRFSRIQHYAPGKNLLDWADRHGMLLILETGMWGFTAEDYASEELRSQFRYEMEQMVRLAENHPSIIGWSLGNEYESWLPEGIDWTRDMSTFMREQDPERLITFTARGGALRRLLETDSPGVHAFDFVDLISATTYFDPQDLPKFIDPVHERWPDKPFFIAEYGRRADIRFTEEDRMKYFDEVFELIRKRPWICGFSVWSFNDYRSRYPGTGPDGYRRWGIVDEYRTPRRLYHHMTEQLREHEWMTIHPGFD